MSQLSSQNPKESAGRWATLEAYIKMQYALLQAESEAREEAMLEARKFDSRVRSTYTELRRSGNDREIATTAAGEPAIGLRLKRPQAVSEFSPGHKREVTLLQNGLIVERVDVRQEEKEEAQRQRRQERSERTRSRGMSTPGLGADTTSLYSAPGHRRNTGLYSVSSQQSLALSASPALSRPMSQPFLNGGSPSRPYFGREPSQTSIETKGKSRFFGFRQSTGAWASEVSLNQSGSMYNLQYVHHATLDLLQVVNLLFL